MKREDSWRHSEDAEPQDQRPVVCPEKLPYRAPTLKRCGDVATLTRMDGMGGVGGGAGSL